MPHFVDLLELDDHKVTQVTSSDTFLEAVSREKFDLWVLDLMLPEPSLSQEHTASGYATGAFIYNSLSDELRRDNDFVVFSAAPVGSTILRKWIDTLQSNVNCLGVFRKGVDDEKLEKKISQLQKEIES